MVAYRRCRTCRVPWLIPEKSSRGLRSRREVLWHFQWTSCITPSSTCPWEGPGAIPVELQAVMPGKALMIRAASRAPRFQTNKIRSVGRGFCLSRHADPRGGPKPHGPPSRRERAMRSQCRRFRCRFPRPGTIIVVEPWPRSHPRNHR